jgi:hypothetical protein
MTTAQKQQHNDFKAAKKIALSLPKGTMRRAYNHDNRIPTNYIGMKDTTGRCWVLGDSIDDVQYPDAYINDQPAREVFDGFTIMS